MVNVAKQRMHQTPVGLCGKFISKIMLHFPAAATGILVFKMSNETNGLWYLVSMTLHASLETTFAMVVLANYFSGGAHLLG